MFVKKVKQDKKLSIDEMLGEEYASLSKDQKKFYKAFSKSLKPEELKLLSSKHRFISRNGRSYYA